MYNWIKITFDSPMKGTWNTHQGALASVIALTLLGRFSTRCCKWLQGSVRPTGNVGWWGLAHSRWSYSSLRCTVEVQVWALWGPVKFFHTRLRNPVDLHCNAGRKKEHSTLLNNANGVFMVQCLILGNLHCLKLLKVYFYLISSCCFGSEKISCT